MDCERLAPNFSLAEISLQEFLTISDMKLNQIGIEMPYQRNAIRLGLFNMFNAKWSRKSLYIPSDLRNQVTSLDLVYTLSNLLRHIVVMKCQLEFYRGFNFTLNTENAERILTLEYLHNFQRHIENVKGIIEKMKPTERPLLIERVIKKKTSRRTKISLGALAFITPIAVYYFLKK